jgi:hypothetical protein
MEFTDTTPPQTDPIEKYWWTGKGHITFYVIQNVPGAFEINVEDYSGCAIGMEEIIGIEWWIASHTGEDGRVALLNPPLREGCHYTITSITSKHTRGDGYTTEDEIDWRWKSVSETWYLWERVRQKISNWWWRGVTQYITPSRS